MTFCDFKNKHGNSKLSEDSLGEKYLKSFLTTFKREVVEIPPKCFSVDYTKCSL